MSRFVLALTLALIPFAPVCPQPPTRSQRDGLQALGELVGSWRGTGVPVGSRDEQNKNFWTESIRCEWKFKGADAWLVFAFDKSKYSKSGELRYVPDKNLYRFALKTADDKTLDLSGELKAKNLTLQTDDGAERFVFTLLHENRFLYHKEIRPEGKTTYKRLFNVGATKEGVPFAAGSALPECIVTGGLGTSTVSYQGRTYYVCCTGCRDEFLADPARYVKEFETKKAKK